LEHQAWIRALKQVPRWASELRVARSRRMKLPSVQPKTLRIIDLRIKKEGTAGLRDIKTGR